jgi:pimeloyl-ACP methyl ester carboxylesterase
MGEEDYMFLPAVEYIVNHHSNSYLQVIGNSGHVCNIDQPQEFNARAIRFLCNISPQALPESVDAMPQLAAV